MQRIAHCQDTVVSDMVGQFQVVLQCKHLSSPWISAHTQAHHGMKNNISSKCCVIGDLYLLDGHYASGSKVTFAAMMNINGE